MSKKQAAGAAGNSFFGVLYEFIRKDSAMNNTKILTTLLLSCAITGLYAAAPGGAGDAEAGNSTGRLQATRDITPEMQRSGLLGSVGSALSYAAEATRSTGRRTGEALANAYSGTRRWLTGGRPGASSTGSAAADYKPSEETERSLEDIWLLHSQQQLQDQIARQLAKNLSEAGIRSGAGAKDIARHLKGAGGLFTTAIREKVRRNLLLSEPVVIIELPLSKAYQGDYESFRDTLIAYLNDELVKIGTHHRVIVDLSYRNLGELVRNNQDQFVDLMRAVYDTIDSHQCLLTGLNLNGNGLTTLPPGVFTGLINLQLLWLGRNQLANLPPGIFAGLTDLQELRLDGNKLAIMPPDIFAGLTNLQILLLNSNQLVTLPAGIFAGLTNLQRLWLSGNQLAALPAGIFAGLINLQILALGVNKLTTLSAGILADLTKLQELYLFGNQLPPDAQEAIRRELPTTIKIWF